LLVQVICKQEFQSKPCPQALLVCCTVLVCKGLHTPGLFKTDAIPQDVTESLAALLGGGEETIAGLLYILIRTAHRPLQGFHVSLSEQPTDHYRPFMYSYQNRPQTITGLSCIPIRTGHRPFQGFHVSLSEQASCIFIRTGHRTIFVSPLRH
jgi:hypothetical protein